MPNLLYSDLTHDEKVAILRTDLGAALIWWMLSGLPSCPIPCVRSKSDQ